MPYQTIRQTVTAGALRDISAHVGTNMSRTPSTDPASLRDDRLPSFSMVTLALTMVLLLLLLQSRSSFLRPLTWWVAEAFGAHS